MSLNQGFQRSHRKSLRGNAEVHWINQDGKIVPSFKQNAQPKQKPEKLTPRTTLDTPRKPTSNKSTKTHQFTLSIDQIRQTPTYKQKIHSTLNSTRFSLPPPTPTPTPLQFSLPPPNPNHPSPLSPPRTSPRPQTHSHQPPQPLAAPLAEPLQKTQKFNNNLQRMQRIKVGITNLYRDIHK